MAMSDATTHDAALTWDPFEGERDVDAATLRNRLIRTRAAHLCHLCAGVIPPRTAGVRSMTQTFDGEIGTWWWCPLCVDAMRRDEDWYDAEPDDVQVGPWVEEPPTYRRFGLGHWRRAQP